MALLKIDGVLMPTPTKYDFELSDMDSEKSGRDLDLIMTRDRKRSNVYAFQLSWENIGFSELRTINNAVKPVFVNVEFLDPVSGGTVSKKMYAGNKKIGTSIIRGDLRAIVGSISFNLIER